MMRLSDLGERKLLKEIVFKYLESPDFEDEDAAILRFGNEFFVINVDTFVESTDMPRGMTYYDVGWKSVMMAVSDIVAKGAVPKGVLVSITASENLDVSAFEYILRGIRAACDFLGCWYVGGDLGAGKDLVVSVVCFGLTKKVIRRSTAKVGDSVWVTDLFGISGLALHYLLRDGIPIENIDNILQNFFRPRIDIKYALALQSLATASMDSSDGLAVTLNDIASASNVAINLHKIPISPLAIDYANRNDLDPMDLALFAGEEFIIVFSSDRPDSEIFEVFEKLGLRKPIKIGEVVEGRGVFFEEKKIPRKGWEHFSKE